MATKQQTTAQGSAKVPAKDATPKDEPEVAERGTAAGLRAGAESRSEAKAMTAPGRKQNQKEATKRGGPGHAGTNTTTGGDVAKKTKPTRSRGTKARAGA